MAAAPVGPLADVHWEWNASPMWAEAWLHRPNGDQKLLMTITKEAILCLDPGLWPLVSEELGLRIGLKGHVIIDDRYGDVF